MKRLSMRIGAMSVVGMLVACATLGAGEIWDGGGDDNNWSTDANWDGLFREGTSPPNNGTANIHFVGNDRTLPNVDVPWSIHSLTFDAGSISFFVTGQELTIGAGGVTNNDNSGQVVLAPVKLAANQTWNAAGSLLQMNPINLNGFALTMGGAFNTTLNGAISGAGSLTLPAGYAATVTMSGTTSNSHTATTVVNGGTLLLSKAGGDVAISGDLTVSGGIVRLGGNEQLAHNAGQVTRVEGSGTIDLNGFTETFAKLWVDFGTTVTTGSGRILFSEELRALPVAGVNTPPTLIGNIDLGGGNPLIAGHSNDVILELIGPISNGSLRQSGLVRMTGGANTYTGTTQVDGWLYLNKPGTDNALRGDVVINGVVELEASEQIRSAVSDEVLIDGGELVLNSFSETVRDLTLMNDGDVKGRTIESGPGSITMLGTIRAFGAGNGIETLINLGGAPRTFDVAAGGDLALRSSLPNEGIISNGSLVKTGPGVLSMSNSVNTYIGGTTVTGGILRVGGESSLGPVSSPLHLNGGVLEVDGTSFTSTSRTISFGSNGGGIGVSSPLGVFTVSTHSFSGSGAFTKTGPGKLNLLAPQSYTGGTTVASGTLEGNTQTIQGDIVNHGRIVFNQATNGTYAGNLGGSGELTKQNTGTLTLSGNNSYTGRTTVDDGTLKVTTGSSLGVLSQVAIGNATLDLGAFDITVGSIETSLGNGIVHHASGVLTTGGNINKSFSGTITGGGSIRKVGAGTWSLSGNNTYSGGTTIVEGAISISSENQLGAPAAPLRFDGGTLRVMGNLTAMTRPIEWLPGGAGIDVFSQPAVFTLSNNVTGAGGLSKYGLGTLVLSGSNSYGGATSINAGTLRTLSGNAITDSSPVTIANVAGAALELVDHDETIASLAGGGPLGGNVILGATLTTGGDNSSTTFGGAMSGVGGLIKTGEGVFTLTGSNTYLGLTDIQQGTLRQVSAASLPDNAAVTVAFGATLDLNGLSRTLTTLAGGGQVVLGAATLTLGANDASSDFNGRIDGSGGVVKGGTGTIRLLDGPNTYTGGTTVVAGTLVGPAGALQGDIVNHGVVGFHQGADGVYDGVLSGPGSLIKLGPGRTTVATPATYTGETAVADGTLHLPGTLNTRGGAIDIQDDGVLEASGILQRAISGAGHLTATGNLVAGDLTSPDGLRVYSVNIGSHAVVLLDADRAEIETGTIAGGALTTLAGLSLVGGTFGGHGTVNGTFVNNGSIAGPIAPAALSFTGPLSGAGSYTGNVRILDEFSPGNSPAEVSFERLTFGGASTLIIEIGGETPGSEHDQVVVAGSAALAGVLRVETIDGYSPSTPGESFEVLTYGARTGAFTTVEGMPSAALAGLYWTLAYTPTSVVLTATAMPGDIDLDGEVDRTDAVLFSQFFGRESDSTWTTGDFGDGQTSLADWGLLQSHFGELTPSPSAAAVPEPSAFLLFLLGTATLLAKLRILPGGTILRRPIRPCSA